MRRLEFFVPGTVRPKGSMRSFKHAHTGNVVTLPSSKDGVTWESDVKRFAAEAWHGPLLAEPVAVNILIVVARLKSHWGTGRNAGKLKDSAPDRVGKERAPDGDKAARAVLDAMTGVVYEDDQYVATLHVEKWFGQKPGVYITLDTMPVQDRVFAARL